MSSGKLIKIIKSSKHTYWYADKIGNEYVVTDDVQPESYILLESYDKVRWIPATKFIEKCDTEVISRVSYETLFSAKIVVGQIL